jgi:hydrogenase maturation factor HypF (carbamoyltransferase family)
MATIKICDVCKKEHNELKESRYRSGWTNNIKIDVCEEHKTFIKGKTPEQVTKWLYGWE